MSQLDCSDQPEDISNRTPTEKISKSARPIIISSIWTPALLIGSITTVLIMNQAGFFGSNIEGRFAEVDEGVTPTFFETEQTRKQKRIIAQVKKIVPLQEKLTKPEPGEWLAQHRESGQTFAQYTRGNPVTVSKKRKFLYVQPIGKFEGKQKKILEKSCEFLGIYYGVEVKTLPKTDTEDYPVDAVRRNPYSGQKQILTDHVLYKVLRPKLPDDAVAFIAFTDTDLWPGENWNFVFGQAALKQRVGVWSLARHGDPEKNFKQCLLRSIKVATHETGHMFSMNHCIFYRCNMQGSNSLPESDRQPSTLCPHCLAKVMYATDVDPVERYKKMIAFCDKNRLRELKTRLGKHLRAIQGEQ